MGNSTVADAKATRTSGDWPQIAHIRNVVNAMVNGLRCQKQKRQELVSKGYLMC